MSDLYVLQQLGGFHVQTDPDGRERRYGPNGVFLNRVNLADRWPEKFRRLHPDDPLARAALGDNPPPNLAVPGPGEASALVAPPKGVETNPPAVAPMVAKSPAADSLGIPPRPLPDLSKMTNKELIAFAAAEEIDLGGAVKREQQIEMIKISWAGRHGTA